jgi:uncharacterized membrane protein (UPF0127 family)
MRFLLLAALLPFACCGPKPTTLEDFATQPVTLPGGQVIRVETMIDNIDLIRGLMFRTALASDHGMLFVHAQPGNYQHWMYQVLIPLDIIWLDSNRDIVEIVENVQPCKTQASKCPQYGGHQLSTYVLELAGGMARKYGLSVGQRAQW